MDFLTLGVKKTFIQLRKSFIKASILYYFDIKCHLCIKTDVLGYAIGRVLSQITLDQLFCNHVIHANLELNSFKFEIGQRYSIAFFFKKMIPIKIQYKTHN